MPKYVFGPVPSRRLGLSLGVDLLPPKTCSFDCLYCQVGRTTHKSAEPKVLVPVAEVLDEVRRILETASTDVVTLAGSGEPTLHSRIDAVIRGLKSLTSKPVVLLSNGSLFWREEVLRRVLAADVIMPTLCSADPGTFERIHRPHPEITLERVIRGLMHLRKVYRGRLALEVVLLAGINDTPGEIAGLRSVIGELSPDCVYLNTVARPPSDSQAKALLWDKLETVREYLGEKAEIIAAKPVSSSSEKAGSMAEALLEMIRRRPLRVLDMQASLGLQQDEVEALVKGLQVKGRIRPQEQGGEIFFLSTESDEI